MKTLPKKDVSFPQNSRLRLKSQYDAVRIQGVSVYGSFFRFHCLKRSEDPTQLGIIVPKRVGPAVTRNKIKRRFREIYRLDRSTLQPHFWLVIVASPKAATASFQELKKEWLRLGKKLSLFSFSQI